MLLRHAAINGAKFLDGNGCASTSDLLCKSRRNIARVPRALAFIITGFYAAQCRSCSRSDDNPSTFSGS
jgi:hypothetical protein